VGRHSSGGGWSYYLSFALWALPWVVIACLVGFAVWIAVDTVGGDQVTVQSPSPETTPTPTPTPTPSPTRPEPSPVAKPTPTPESEKDETDRRKRAEGDRDGTGLTTEGVTVQVINGTGGVVGAAEAMADRLARLGYTVEAFTTGLTVDQSLVLFSTPEDSAAAVELAGYLGFVAGPAPPDLSRDIDLHVIVSAADA
jgi:LytR cell envelope-related transcriptional attenuator